MMRNSELSYLQREHDLGLGTFQSENMVIWLEVVAWRRQRRWLLKNNIYIKDWEEEKHGIGLSKLLRARHRKLSYEKIIAKMKAMQKNRF
jgi:hypothetical protein